MITLWSVKKHIIPALILITLVFGGAAYYFYVQSTTLEPAVPKNTDTDAKALIGKVGQLILLPEDETPTVATVADPEALRNQPFFANAKRGDRVLFYPIARRAVLYDPVQDKIIEIAPLNSIEQPGATPSLSATSSGATPTAESASSTTSTSTPKTKPKP